MKKLVKVRSEEILLIEHRRAHNICIELAGVRMPFPDIKVSCYCTTACSLSAISLPLADTAFSTRIRYPTSRSAHFCSKSLGSPVPCCVHWQTWASGDMHDAQRRSIQSHRGVVDGRFAVRLGL